MDYRGLMGSWIMDYHGLLWIIVVHCGVSWILDYAPPWNRMDNKICTPRL
jgi:hypothetical protein